MRDVYDKLTAQAAQSIMESGGRIPYVNFTKLSDIRKGEYYFILDTKSC